MIQPLNGWIGLVAWAVVVCPPALAAIIYWNELSQNVGDRVLTAQWQPDHFALLLPRFP